MSKINSNSTSNNQQLQYQIAEDQRLANEERKELQRQHEVEKNQLERAFQEASAAQRDRYETQVQAQKLENYENLRHLKRQTAREENALRKQAQERIRTVETDLYKDSLHEEREYRDRLNRIQSEHQIALQNEQLRGAEQSELLKKVTSKQTQDLFDDTNKQLEKVQKQKTTELDLQKSSAALANQEAKEKFDFQRAEVQRKYDEEFRELQTRAADTLKNMRRDHATKLTAYQSRAQDPFYHLVSANSTVADIGDSLEIRIRVPEHEKGNIRLQLNNREAQVSGVRSNNEQVDTGKGKVVSTTSYQTYTEKFMLPTSVDSKSLRLVDDGSGDIVYLIDKEDASRRSKMYKAPPKHDDSAQIPTPDYPSTLLKASTIPQKSKPKTII